MVPPARDKDKTRLSQETVVERAVVLADSEGLAAVTIRRLAQDLGVTPMALYWHFRTKEELLTGLVDRVLAEMDFSVDRAAAWTEQLRSLMSSIVGALRAHPWATELFPSSGTPSESYLRGLEAMLDVLRGAGFSPREATEISRHALRTAITLVSDEQSYTDAQEAGGAPAGERRMRVFLETLPSDRYPRIVEAAGPLSGCDDADAYYARGLDLFLAGVEATANS